MAINQKDYNLVPFLGLVITVVTVLWFAFQKIDVGYTYTMLFLVPIALLFASFLFIDEQTKKGILRKLKVPFTTSTPGGAALLLLGWLVFLVVNTLGRIVSSSFSITSFNIPLVAEKSGSILIQQTSQQLAITTSNAINLFVTTFVASFIEEFVFRFIIIFISYILAIFIIRGITNKKPSHITALVLALGITALAFGGVHLLNGSYEGVMYLVAMTFAVLMSASIYYAGAFLSFTIGFHQANNFIWYVETNGWTVTQQALMSPLGYIMIAYMLLMIIIVLNNLKPASKFIVRIVRDLKKGIGI